MEIKSPFSEETEKYFARIAEGVKLSYEVAEQAKKKGIDPVDKVEVPLALTMAAKVVRLIATLYPQLDREDIIERILELERIYGALDNTVTFKIAEEIAQEKYCKFENQMQAIDAGIRVGFAYVTLGVVSSPIEGYTEIRTGTTQDGKTYLKPFFSGPVRSAGTTGTCVTIILIDYLRQIFGYARYDPTEEECRRMFTELTDYHEKVNNLQYMPTEAEAIFIAKNMPIQVEGDPTDQKEVSNYKDLPRMSTNFIRGGMCLAMGEGIAQKAAKALRILKGIKKNGIVINDWDWLEGYVELHEKRTLGKTGGDSPTYLKDLVAGRPVFGHPGKGFRFRYGKSRLAGFSAVSVHPATMVISNDFIATGTQLKIERPTKGCVTTPCDVIDGPIVKLKNGSVKKLRTELEARMIKKEVEEIVYIGDILFPLGDVQNRNSMLLKPGYVEEWWNLEVEKIKGKGFDNFYNLDLETVLKISEETGLPLYPQYIFYWTQINQEQFLSLIDWLQHSRVLNHKLILPFNKTEKERFQIAKRTLEILGVEHDVVIENVVLNEENTKSLLINLGMDKEFEGEIHFDFDWKSVDNMNVLEIVNKLSKFKIKDKAGQFIGSRMGRPEKAKLRKLTGSPNVLFSIGEEGGRLRSVNEAVTVGSVRSSFPFNYCEKCSRETIYKKCEICGSQTIPKYYCPMCKKELTQPCQEHNRFENYKDGRIDMVHYFKQARDILGLDKFQVPELIKGIRGTSSGDHSVEHLAKGILRAKYNLCVNKDGTIRYDMTELPISHFKPREVGVSFEKLKSLGYEKDYLGNELVSDDQILTLQPHDVILPCNSEAGDEKADDVFVNASHFMDEMLEKLYGLPRFYNIKNRDDLIGHLGVCMAPHNCAGVICRIVGFSKVQGLYASAYMHAAIRRDCDGDEAAFMLLLDVLINFSRKFLPAHRGGTQDAPLVLNGRINAKEVDDQILDLELGESYPLELYEKAEQGLHSGEVSIDTVKGRLKRGEDPFINIGYTHPTSDFNIGVTCSSYKTLPTMHDKVASQMDLCEKLRAVDQSDVARLIIDRHFMRDLKGNLRKFSQQSFRCSHCNEIFRRPPLEGKCTKCKGKLIFTISYGSIVKYLEPALELARKYNVPPYIQQDLELTKKYIQSIFGKDTEKQTGLGAFM